MTLKVEGSLLPAVAHLHINRILKSIFISRLPVSESLASISINVVGRKNCQIVSKSINYSKMMKEYCMNYLK